MRTEPCKEYVLKKSSAELNKQQTKREKWGEGITRKSFLNKSLKKCQAYNH